MTQNAALKIIATRQAAQQPSRGIEHVSQEQAVGGNHHSLFHVIWWVSNLLLILATCLAVYSLLWEYSTRRYLKGFSDAIVPASSSPEGKIEAILNWMSNGPARQSASSSFLSRDRDPIDTLNYTSLLQVCGSATNAFVNLADSSGLSARRLLLIDATRRAKHVVAEVLIDGRWIVVDPAYRVILTAEDGTLLTRQDLANPAVFSLATSGISGYQSDYTYDRTSHVRLSRVPFIGRFLRLTLDRYAPAWQDSVVLSLLLERRSLAALIASLILLFAAGFWRFTLRWYGERHLEVRSIRFRVQVRRALEVFFDRASS